MKLMDLQVWILRKYRKNVEIKPGKSAIIPTGLALSIPKIMKYKLDRVRD